MWKKSNIVHRGLRFSIVFPNYKTFKMKVKYYGIDINPDKYMFEIINRRFADREFKWMGEKQVMSHLEEIWSTAEWKVKIQKELMDSTYEELSSLDNEISLYNINTKEENKHGELTEGVEFLTNRQKIKDIQITKLELLKQIGTMKSAITVEIDLFRKLFLAYIK